MRPGTSARLGRRNRSLALPSAILVVIVAGAYLVLEGDLLEGALAIRQWFTWGLNQFGAAASYALLYAEESGIPLPIPGDVYVAYIGHWATGSMGGLIAAWLGIIGVVTAGASNLYFISRRWGPRLVRHRMARAFHIDPERVTTASRWFARWGVLAIIFGRHIPGFRVPLTAVAGISNFPYRKFAPSVAISTSVWAAFFMVLGNTLAQPVTSFVNANTWLYAVGTALVVGIVLYFGIRVVRIARTLEPQSESDQLSEQHQPVVVASTRGAVVPASWVAENAKIY